MCIVCVLQSRNDVIFFHLVTHKLPQPIIKNNKTNIQRKGNSLKEKNQNNIEIFMYNKKNLPFYFYFY